MKYNSSIGLMTLLKLLSDDFQPDEKRRIEEIIREDADALARFQQLRDAANSSRRLQFDSGLIASNDLGEIQERTAGFFDGTLSAAETVAFENECWESRELLHDVIGLFQSGLHSQQLLPAASDQFETREQQRLLRKRLVDLFPAEPSTVPAVNGVKTALRAATDQASRSLDAPVESTVERPVVIVPGRSPNNPETKAKLSIAVKIAIAVSVTAALVAFSIMISDSFWMDSPSTVVVESPNDLKDQVDPVPRVASPRDSAPIDVNPDSIQPEKIVDLENPLDLPKDLDLKPPGLIDPPTRDVPAPEGLANTTVPKTTVSPETEDKAVVALDDRLPKLVWNWDRIEGLVAVRDAGSDIWSGALADDDLKSEKRNETGTAQGGVGKTRGLECKVLPLSWASGSVIGLGSLTITENTDFAVSTIPVRDIGSQSAYERRNSPGSSVPEGVRIQLSGGGIAITNAEVNSTVLVETTSGNWRIRITDPDSIIVVEHGLSSRVIVQKGSATVNESLLQARQQMFRARDGRLEQATNRETIKWLRRPEYKFPSKQLSAQWLASGDLFAELSSPNVISPEDQALVRAAFATIDPPGQAAKYLANVLPEVRAEGIEWLLLYGRDPQRLRKLTNELATELNAPGLATTLPKLVIAIHRKRLPPKTDVEWLVSGLQNRNVSVRRLSHGFLVHLFGSLEDYDSESDATTRHMQSRKWLAAINRLYRRLENARRR